MAPLVNVIRLGLNIRDSIFPSKGTRIRPTILRIQKFINKWNGGEGEGLALTRKSICGSDFHRNILLKSFYCSRKLNSKKLKSRSTTQIHRVFQKDAHRFTWTWRKIRAHVPESPCRNAVRCTITSAISKWSWKYFGGISDCKNNFEKRRYLTPCRTHLWKIEERRRTHLTDSKINTRSASLFLKLFGTRYSTSLYLMHWRHNVDSITRWTSKRHYFGEAGLSTLPRMFLVSTTT